MFLIAITPLYQYQLKSRFRGKLDEDQSAPLKGCLTSRYRDDSAAHFVRGRAHSVRQLKATGVQGRFPLFKFSNRMEC